MLLQKLKSIFLLLFLSLVVMVDAQQPVPASLSTDFMVVRNFHKQQEFWAVGQTIAGHFHITPNNGVYAWLMYCTNGRFTNHLSATAKSPLTTPQAIAYDNYSKMKFQHISIGWKHYFKGAFDNQKWNLYGLAGLGLMMGQVLNSHSVLIDSSSYSVPVKPGQSSFKRLTFDAGLGYEKNLGADIYFYLEARALLPATDYPNDHIYINKNSPLIGCGNLGIRILFY